jgi:hypothetical protein
VARPRRTVAARPSRRELLVFAEGEVTEEDYLKHWHRRFRARVNVEIHEFHGTPLALVQRAVEAKDAEEKAERRGKGRAHDEVWCVFDVDQHPLLGEAIDFAKANDIHLAISNPCIELWFVLHFADQAAYIDSHAAQRLARGHLDCDKALSVPALAALDRGYDEAKARAQSLDIKHHGDGTPAPGNPSSSIWQLTDSISSVQFDRASS